MRKAELIIEADLWHWYPDLVISGGADGIDTVADITATGLNFPFELYLPEKPNWTYYQLRDAQMAIRCDALVCIRSIQSKTYGSGWTADFAESMGKPVARYMI
jgi:hypothetical protein